MNENVSFEEANAAWQRREYSFAFRAFLNLAKKGDLSSMVNVAIMYSSGSGVSQNTSKAIFWEKKAAALGSIPALLNLGISYRNIGDIEKSKKYFLKSLSAGDPEAALELAKMYTISSKEIDSVLRYAHIALSNPNLLEKSRIEAERIIYKYNKFLRMRK